MMGRSGKRALVAGGAGFVGSQLVEKLLEDECKVICVDNLVTGREENIAGLKGLPGFLWMRKDINTPLSVEGRIDEIYNLASPASPPEYRKHPVFTALTNIVGTKNLLDLAREKGAKFFLASTSEIYGDPKEHPQKETYFGNVDPTSPRSCYDEGQRMAETISFDYHREHGVVIKVARIFNTYGPRMRPDDGRVVSNFIKRALAEQEIEVYGSGLQTRSFQYIDDLVCGIRSMMKYTGTGPINLGNPNEECTILELAKMIIDLTGSKSKITHKGPPENDPVRRRPDITKARAELRWEPKVSLREGLKKTIEYFRDFEIWK